MSEKMRPSKIPSSELEEEKVKDSQRQAKLKKLHELESHLHNLTAQEISTETEDVTKQMDTGDSSLAAVEASIKTGIQKQLKGEPQKISDAEIDRELEALEAEIAAEKTAIEVKSTFDKLLEIHPWLNEKKFGFMYAYPDPKKDKNNFASWLDDWTKVMFDYAKVTLEHILYPNNLLTEEPFRRFEKPKNSTDLIAEELVRKKLAAWMDRKKEKLRVYWRSMEEWAILVTKWARDNAFSDPLMLPDIRNSGEEFANLPDEDVKLVFELIQKQNAGQMVQLSKAEFAIKIRPY
jgi:hypothetical protein